MSNFSDIVYLWLTAHKLETQFITPRRPHGSGEVRAAGLNREVRVVTALSYNASRKHDPGVPTRHAKPPAYAAGVDHCPGLSICKSWKRPRDAVYAVQRGIS